MNTGKHRQRLRIALTLVKASTLGCLLSLLVVGALGTDTAGGEDTRTDDAYARVVARAVADERCSYDGFSGSGTAASALIRTEGGNLRVVSFETGWQVYNGQRPGVLVAVCLDDRTTTAAHLRQARAAG